MNIPSLSRFRRSILTAMILTLFMTSLSYGDSEQWSAAGSMTTARSGHSGTLLPNGKVLVAGGYNNTNASYLSSAELYDPATNSWSAASSMASARSGQTATLLNNGKVLVVGGYGNSYLASAELYDPVTNSWSAAGSMAFARSGHTATLLPSGKVLVVGGYENNYLASAELYDPATTSWSVISSMSFSRGYHTATLLNNGKVLVAGGIWTMALSSTELYDPVTGSWSAADNLATAHQLHSATLLPNEKLMVAGGTAYGNGISSTELYDPGTDFWSMSGAMTSGRFYFTATLLSNGKVLAAGGLNGPSIMAAISSTELYNPASNSWSTTDSMATARQSHTATLLADGRLLVVGGVDNNNITLSSAELYDPAANGIDATPPETTASPSGGIYSAPQSVTLAANEPATIYYTTNGSEPTTASAVYYDPISIAGTTTLKFFAVDLAGNSESVKSAFYSINSYSVPSTVTGYQPANGATAPVTTSVQATFDIPLDPLSITPESLTVSGTTGVKALAAGGSFSVALKNDGTVAAWGGGWSQTTVPPGLSGVKAIAASGWGNTAALKNDGTVVVWGDNTFGQHQVPFWLSGVTAIDTGGGTVVAVQNNGTVVAWGSQTYVPPGLSGITAVSAGASHILALKNNGTVIGWGNNNSGQTSIPENLSGVIAITTGMDHSVALKNDGTMVAWGDNSYGQTTIPYGLSGVIAIDAAGGNTAAIMNDGTAVVWGYNSSGQNVVLHDISAISGGGGHMIALKKDGTVVAWGDNSSGQTSVPADLGVSNVNGSISYDPATLTVTFVPSSSLASGAPYIATVTGVRSQTGVPLAAPVSWNFTALDTMLPLNLSFAGAGTGRVDFTSGGSCTGSCSNSFNQGSAITLTANPATNNIFGGWSGCDWVGGNQCSVTISGIRNVTASFLATGVPVTLTVNKSGSGSGTVISNPAGINLSSSWYGTAQYAAGTNVTLTAASESGSIFSGWRGACTGLGKCTITLDSDSWAIAVFTSASTGNPGPVKINNQFFPLFQDAYNAMLDGSTATIFANSLNVSENLVFDRNIVVTLKGGYDSSFGTNSGLTVLKGTLTITSGSVIMENIVIQ